jgi:pyruvate dehydrogenase (quinone)
MSQTVSELLVGVLEQVGVRQIFGLIGDSLNPLADAVRRSQIEWIGVRHEEGTDFIQTTSPDLLFRDVSLYTETISSPAQAPAVIHQAIAAAYAGPGVAHLTLPQDVLSAKADGAASSVATLKPRSEISPNEADVAEIVSRINAASSVVIMCGAGCRGAAELLRALSDRLKAPLIHSVRGKEMMAYDDPHWMGGLGMIGTRAVYNAARHCDLLLMVGTDYPYSNFLPSEGIVIQVDERAQVLGRRAPTVLGVTGSARPTLRLLLEQVAAKTSTKLWDKVTGERRKWDEMLTRQADLARSKDRIHPQAVARAVSDLAKPNAIFVLDTGLNTLWSANWIRQTGSQRIIGSFNNAAVGTALGQANGVQVLDRSRQVIVLTGDGGFNMLMGEFMTAVHHKLPVKVIIYNNSALGLITLEAESVGLVPFREAIEFPNPDFAALARACGGHGFTAKQPGELKAALSKAFAVDGPAIVDAIVPADEMPNMPHVELEQVGNFALAKIKEAVLAVTG